MYSRKEIRGSQHLSKYAFGNTVLTYQIRLYQKHIDTWVCLHII
jgi:hypothetical protein